MASFFQRLLWTLIQVGFIKLFLPIPDDAPVISTRFPAILDIRRLQEVKRRCRHSMAFYTRSRQAPPLCSHSRFENIHPALLIVNTLYSSEDDYRICRLTVQNVTVVLVNGTGNPYQKSIFGCGRWRTEGSVVMMWSLHYDSNVTCCFIGWCYARYDRRHIFGKYTCPSPATVICTAFATFSSVLRRRGTVRILLPSLRRHSLLAPNFWRILLNSHDHNPLNG